MDGEQFCQSSNKNQLWKTTTTSIWIVVNKLWCKSAQRCWIVAIFHAEIRPQLDVSQLEQAVILLDLSEMNASKIVKLMVDEVLNSEQWFNYLIYNYIIDFSIFISYIEQLINKNESASLYEDVANALFVDTESAYICWSLL